MKTKQIINTLKIREDFPILKSGELTYLDSSATSLTPKSVVDSMIEYYEKYNANIHRGMYEISQKATDEYEKAHQKVADFINAKFEEIIFTKSTTESLNLLAYTLTKKLAKGDEILVTIMEHHSNLVPWQQLAKERGLVLKYIPLKEDSTLDLEKASELITNKTKIVAITYMSNVLGTINDVKKIAKLAHSKGAYLIIDGAQAVPHFKIDVRDLDCDFLTFSGHKMLGPTGIGVLYGKKDLLNKMDPFLYGGDMILEVGFQDSKWNELPWKFEAGTPNIAEAIGLGKAIDYLSNIGMENIEEYEKYLTEYALEKMKTVEGVKIFGKQDAQNRGGVISFNIDNIHPHDVASILDRSGIAVRGGHMCAMPLVSEHLSQTSVSRASFYIYNTINEIDKFVNELNTVKGVFKNDK